MGGGVFVLVTGNVSDIMLISPLCQHAANLLHLCESELLDLDLSLNAKEWFVCILVLASTLLAPT